MQLSIEELARRIAHFQERYYNAQPEISDQDFDRLWDELQARDPGNPVLHGIGKDSAPGFRKRVHVMPMHSQDKASNAAQFMVWANRVDLPVYIVQYKLDGASIELQYSDGKLVAAVTRGDGQIGDDITANVLKMGGALNTISVGDANAPAFSGAVRGEIIMEHHIHAEHYTDKANCRNAANGIMKRKDGVGAEHLRILCYDAFVGPDSALVPAWSTDQDEIAKIAWMSDAGFDVVHCEVFETPQQIVAYRDQVSLLRPDLGYDIDGLVVKGPAIDIDDSQRARPQKQIAFKFSAEEATSTLRDVEWSTSGHLYTPVAIVDPVNLAGTTVRRASLVHPELIHSLGLRIGSEVIISKRGDIIPKIERVVGTTPTDGGIRIPDTCEVCGTELRNEGKRLLCPNPDCSKRRLHRVRKWLDTLDVAEFGDALLQQLFSEQKVASIADLYFLETDEVARLDRMGETSARTVLSNLKAKKTVPLARFVAGFDIPGIAELKVQRVVDAGFDTLERMRKATVGELAACDGIAEVTAGQIVSGLKELAAEMDAVLATGSISISPAADVSLQTSAHPFAGLGFVFTGTLKRMKRSAAEELVASLGGFSRSSVTNDVAFVVASDPSGTTGKLAKAARAGIPVISEDEFFRRAGV